MHLVLDACRVGDMGIGARHCHFAGLERLAQGIERLSLKFGQFVEEQHAEVCHGNFAGAHAQPAAGEGRDGSRMVWRAIGAGTADAAVLQRAGDRGDHRDFQRLGGCQVRQNTGQARGEQRLAGAWRSDHQEIVCTGGGDLQRAAGGFLPLYLLEIGPALGRIDLAGGWWG